MGMFDKIVKEHGGFETISDYAGLDHLNAYCDSIYQQYCVAFKDASYLKNVEWLLRHYNASKKMTLGVLFYTQTKYLIGHKVKNISFYSLYYSLFNAFSANILLLPKISIEKAHKISHSKIFDYVDNYFIRFNIIPKESIELLNELRLIREAYSYQLPLGGSFVKDGEKLNVENLLLKLESILPIVLQAGNMLSYLSYYAWNKKVGKALDEYEKYQSTVDEMFFSFIEHRDYLDNYCLIDDDDYHRQGYVLRKWSTPFPISWFITEKMCEDLECGWEQTEDEGYNINEVGHYLAQVINAP